MFLARIFTASPDIIGDVILFVAIVVGLPAMIIFEISGGKKRRQRQDAWANSKPVLYDYEKNLENLRARFRQAFRDLSLAKEGSVEKQLIMETLCSPDMLRFDMRSWENMRKHALRDPLGVMTQEEFSKKRQTAVKFVEDMINKKIRENHRSLV